MNNGPALVTVVDIMQDGATAKAVPKVRVQAVVADEPVVIFPALSEPTTVGVVPQVPTEGGGPTRMAELI